MTYVYIKAYTTHICVCIYNMHKHCAHTHTNYHNLKGLVNESLLFSYCGDGNLEATSKMSL